MHNAFQRTLAAVTITAAAGMAPCQPPDPPAVPGFDGKTIKLGVVSALTGPGSVIALPSVDGGDLWWKFVNDNGGIAGKYKVEMVKSDHQNLAPLAVQRFNQIRSNVV